MEFGGHDHGLMIAKSRPLQQKQARQYRALFVGAWIRALGRKPVDVVRATGINEGYLSQIVNGSKKNPSADKLADIADFLGIPVQYLYRPPPDREFLDQAAAWEPGVLSRLRSGKLP